MRIKPLLILFVVVKFATALSLFGQSQDRPKPSNVPMTRPGEVLATHNTRFGHSSTFVELEGGRIIQLAGTTFTTSDDGGMTWSKPFQRKDTNGKVVGGGEGPSLVRLSGKGIGLASAAWESNPSPETEVESGHVVFWRSLDGGTAWEPPVNVSPLGLGTFMLQDVALRTSSGRIVIPMYLVLGQYGTPKDGRQPRLLARSDQDVYQPFDGKLVRGQWVSTSAHFFDPTFSAPYVCYSDDDGRTWKRNRNGPLVLLMGSSASFSYANEPSVAEVAPGKLLMVMRTALGRLYQAWSFDNGETWTRPQPTRLAASTAPAQIRRLPTGHLLIVWNQENEEEVKRGYVRVRLSAAISRNGGSVWEFFQNVESLLEGTRVLPGPIRPARPADLYTDPGEGALELESDLIIDEEKHGRWAYPSVLVLKDRVLVAHTYSTYEDDPTQARLLLTSGQEGGFNQKLKVLPLTWFYGGKKPAENMFFENGATRP